MSVGPSLLATLRDWDRCYPGNVNIHTMVDEAVDRIEELESALASAINALAMSEPRSTYGAQCHRDAMLSGRAALPEIYGS